MTFKTKNQLIIYPKQYFRQYCTSNYTNIITGINYGGITFRTNTSENNLQWKMFGNHYTKAWWVYSSWRLDPWQPAAFIHTNYTNNGTFANQETKNM